MKRIGRRNTPWEVETCMIWSPEPTQGCQIPRTEKSWEREDASSILALVENAFGDHSCSVCSVASNCGGLTASVARTFHDRLWV